MATPNSCEIGRTYYQDETLGPGVDADWTIETVNGNPGVEQSGTRYEHVDDISSGFGDQSAISQTLDASPTIFEAEIGVDMFHRLRDDTVTEGSFTELVGIRHWELTSRFVGLEYQKVFEGFDTRILIRIVAKVAAAYEFTEELFSFLVTTGNAPWTGDFSGMLKVKNIAGNNIELYWNNVLKYTSSSGNYAPDPDVSINLAKVWYFVTAVLTTDWTAWVRNIEYVGTGLPNICPGPNIEFVSNKTSGPNPLYVRFTDVSDLSELTSATDYTRIWSFTNTRTSATEFDTTTSASINHVFNGNYQDTFDVSLSAVY
jgi:hypothetical protein